MKHLGKDSPDEVIKSQEVTGDVLDPDNGEKVGEMSCTLEILRETVNAMGRVSSTGYTRKYAGNFDQVFSQN